MSTQQISSRLVGHRPQRSVLSDDVYEALKALVMDHVVAPGERLSIDFVARELAVSPTPIREALARLEAERLVIKEPLKGYRTTPLLTASEIDDLFEMRMLLEPWSAAQAAARAPQCDLDAIDAETRSLVAVPAGDHYRDYRDVTDHDHRFHSLIAAASANRQVAASFAALHVHLHLFRLHYGHAMGLTVPDEHRRITTAIAARDPGAADTAMRDHLDASRSRLRAAMHAATTATKTGATNPTGTTTETPT